MNVDDFDDIDAALLANDDLDHYQILAEAMRGAAWDERTEPTDPSEVFTACLPIVPEADASPVCPLNPD